MSDPQRYASLVDLQARVTDRPSAAADLTSALDAASSAVEQDCNRVFTLDAAASARTYISRLANKVTVDDIGDATGLVVSTGSASSWSPLPSVDWWTEPTNALAKGWPIQSVSTIGSFVPQPWPTVQVTAKWGWPAVPADITEAVLLLASRLWARRASPTGVAGFGEMGVVRVTSLDADVARLTAPYVRPGFA